jgi:hypothetical protein
MTTISSNVRTKQNPRLDLDRRSYVKGNYQKARKIKEFFEKRPLNLI